MGNVTSLYPTSVAERLDSLDLLRGADGAAVTAYVYGSAPEEMVGAADAVLIIRASHHYNRYVKESHVISFVEGAGFEFLASSEMNVNPIDQPTVDDMVWRLPPTLGTSRENEELKSQMLANGESDRMTLKFRKPE